MAFLNLTSADKSSGESQNLAVAMIANAKLPATIHTAVMTALVSAAKERKASDVSAIPLEKERIETVKRCLLAFTSQPIDATEQIANSAKQTIAVINKALSKAAQKSKEDNGVYQVTLTDAITALEDVNLGVEPVGVGGPVAKPYDLPAAGAMMAHTDVANQFNNHRSEPGGSGYGGRKRRNGNGFRKNGQDDGKKGRFDGQRCAGWGGQQREERGMPHHSAPHSGRNDADAKGRSDKNHDRFFQ